MYNAWLKLVELESCIKLMSGRQSWQENKLKRQRDENVGGHINVAEKRLG